MKRIQIKIFLPLLVMICILAFACKQFLDKPPMGALLPSTLANRTGVQSLLVGAYHKLMGNANWGSAPSNWVYGSVVGGDTYKGSTPSDQGDIVPLEIFAYNANNPYLDQKWVAIYDGAQRANEVLRVMKLATDIPADEVKTMTAEARFLRGFYHFEAKKVWKNV